VARQAGVVAHAVRLTADLQRSNEHLRTARERLVTAREEERRRLRRDLHDSLGPQLAGLVLRLDAARNLLRRDVDAAEMLLQDIADTAQRTVADIRHLVDGLRPRALDELGLIEALRQYAIQYELAGPRISVDAPDRLPPLPAAVEVAAYRIVTEALTNVARHAGAISCAVRLAVDKPAAMLCLEITDDGCGLPLAPRDGVGLASMRERAEELGGSCTVQSAEGDGTTVGVRLPCTVPAPGDPRDRKPVGQMREGT
jgi:signal transduction histidine kinase